MATKDENCVFCKIVAGEIPSKNVYENEHMLAFLDVYPAAKGHILVIPKKHYPTMLDIPEYELEQAIRVVQRVGAAVMKATKADGFNVLQNNREAAGQVIHHLHFHIIPRFKGDGIKIAPGSKEELKHELATWQSEIKKHI